MNGLSLLVALAAVGVDVGWESTSTGKLSYTIRIESVLVDKLGEGSAIESLVDKSDRGLRKFRVAVGPKNLQTERSAAATANEVEYGWRPNENNGIDYYVQISRERLETLARGIPLECEVHPEVPEIDKIYVFVGDTKLPRELPPRNFNTAGNTRGNVAPASGTQTNPGTTRYGDLGYSAPGSPQTNVSDTNRGNTYGTAWPQGNTNNTQTYGQQGYGPAPAPNYGDPGTPTTNRYGQYGDNTLPVPPLDNSRPQDYNRNPYPPQPDPYGVQPQQPNYYSPPPNQTAGQPPQQPYIPPQVPTVPVAIQQQPGPAPTANPTMDVLAAVLALQQKQLDKTPPPPTESEKQPQSSKPLILTTLALFASIGANAYLGWLAWSFFWRFRDASSDLSRARSHAFPAGSVAGH